MNTAGGDLYVWGWNESGQIGLPSKGLREEGQSKEERIGESGQNSSPCTQTSLSPALPMPVFFFLMCACFSIERDKLKGSKKENEGTADVFISIQAFPALVDVSEASEIKKVSCGSRHTAAITSKTLSCCLDFESLESYGVGII